MEAVNDVSYHGIIHHLFNVSACFGTSTNIKQMMLHVDQVLHTQVQSVGTAKAC